MKKKVMNKRGAEMTVGTIVVIILALVVLVVIIYGFTQGWGNLWQKITGLGGGKVNVQDIANGCKIACSSDLTFQYCQKKQNVIFVEKGEKTSLTCYELSKNYPQALEECPTITCGAIIGEGKTCEGGWRGQWTNDQQTTCDKIGVNSVEAPDSLILLSDRTSHANRKCCIAKTDCTGSWVAKNKECEYGYYDVTFMITDAGKTGHETEKCCVQ